MFARLTYLFVTLVLSPLLLMQARYVRWTTPRLPEPPGARQGRQGGGRPLRLLVLGDSSAAGVGVSSQSHALSGQLVEVLAPHYDLTWQVMARTGYRISDVIRAITSAGPYSYDVVLVSVGVNDVTGGTTLHSWKVGISQLCGLLTSKCCAQQLLWSALPPMQSFPSLPRPLNAVLGQRATFLNDALTDMLRQQVGCEVIRPKAEFTSEFLAADGFHPSQRAYAAWAEQVGKMIRDRW